MEGRILTDVSESLTHLGFKPNDEESVKKILQDLNAFSSLVSWLSKELHVLTHSSIDVIASLKDSSSESFLIEVSSTLRALHCPYKSLMTGDLTERLGTDEKKLLLLEFLTTEAQAARMAYVDKQEKRMRLEVRSSPEARDASLLLKSLNIDPSTASSSVSVFFKAVEKQVASCKPQKLPPLLNQSLSPKQWHLVEQAYHRLLKDFTVRRMVLIKRVDVTIQSFRWSSRMRDKQNQLTQVYMPLRQKLSVEPNVQLGDILAARPDVAIQEKTSSQNVRKNTQTSISKVIIGPVPDRGGRSAEMQPPPPEMPSWMKRQEPQRENRGGGRGGFNQGGGRGGYQKQTGGGDRSYAQSSGNNSSYDNHWSSYGGQNDRYNGGQQGGRGGYKHSGQGGQYNQGYKHDQGGYNSGRGGGGQYRNEGRDYVPGRIQDSGWDDSRRGGRGGSHRGGYRGGRGRY